MILTRLSCDMFICVLQIQSPFIEDYLNNMASVQVYIYLQSSPLNFYMYIYSTFWRE